MTSFFERLFGTTIFSDLAEGKRRAATLCTEVVPEETCQRLRRRLSEGEWHFTTGQVLLRRTEAVESDVDWGGHSGYVRKPLVVYGWREHDGQVQVRRLDHSLRRSDIERASDDELLAQMEETEELRFVVAYRRGSMLHGLFALPGMDRWTKLLAREKARAASPAGGRERGRDADVRLDAVREPKRVSLGAVVHAPDHDEQTLDTILTFSDPRFRDGYDVKSAVLIDSKAVDEVYRQLAPDSLHDNLLRDTIAAMRKQWPVLLEELRAGAVIGMHGSVRRFGPQVRYAIWRTGLVDVPRDEWLAAAKVIVDAVHDRDRLLAYRRIGKQYAYQAFQSNSQPEQLAESLSRDLTLRLRQAGDNHNEVDLIVDDLTALGHPLFLWDDRHGGSAWEGYYAYAEPEPGEPKRRVNLQMTVAYGREGRDEAVVEIRVMDAAERPPGFPAE